MSEAPRPAPRAILLDLDGTVYAAGAPIPGAITAIDELRTAGHPLRFFTNTDSRPPSSVRDQLLGYGVEVAPEELFTPVVAALSLLDQPGARAFALVSDALAPLFPERDAAPASTGEGFSHVIVGDCRDALSYRRLDAAFRALRRGARLVALQRGRYFKDPAGDHLDAGALVAALEYAAGVEAVVVGKPERAFFEVAASSAGASTAECVVVGDDATTDIAGGAAVGAQTVQVRTGKYADQRAEGVADNADATIDSLADLPALLVRREW